MYTIGLLIEREQLRPVIIVWKDTNSAEQNTWREL